MKIKKILLSGLLIVMSVSLIGCGSKKSADGGEIFEYGAQKNTDPKIMGQIVKQLIESKTDHEVKITEDIPASPQVMVALGRKDFDFATLYSGEVYNNHFDKEQVEYSTDPQKTIEQAQKLFGEKYKIKWYDSTGYSNQYSIAIKEDFAEKNNIVTMTDLGKVAKDITIGTDNSWIERANDGYEGYKKAYGYKFADAKGMDVALMYKGIENNNLDAVTAYTVDPQILEYKLRVLEDDKEFFPPYDGSIVAREEVLADYPEVGEILDSLVGLIDTDKMTALIHEVDIKERTTEEVAKEFLEEKGML